MEPVIKTAFPFVVTAVAVLIAFQGVLMIVAYTVLAERKVLGWIQGRIGPNRVGPWGLLQPFADLLKFIFKEDLTPDKSTKFVYFLAPIVALTCALMPMVVYPFGPPITTVDWSFLPWHLADGVTVLPLTIARIDVGVLFVLGITSVGVYGIALAGWSSNSKYSLMGGLRSSAQMISYELAMGASVIGVVMLAGTLDLSGIIQAQIESPFRWFIIPQFIGFIVFLMAEYVNMFTVSVMCTVLFLGGWYVPGLSHLFDVGSIPYALVSHIAFIGKICAFLFFYIWVRGTLPRFRFDQLMNFGWKFLLPVALGNVILTIVVVFFLNR